MKLAEGDEGGRGLILDPVPGKAAPPLLLSVYAPRIFPSLWRWQMGRSATLQPRRQEPLLPSSGGCPPGGHCRQPPPLLSLRLARNYIHTALGKRTGVCSGLLPVPPPAPGSSAQRGIRAEKTPAAAAPAARKRRPGGCSYAPLPTPSGCNALGPASARLLPACAGLVRAAVCRCGSSPSPRRPPPRSARLLPPPWGLKMRGPIYSGVARASIRSAEAVAIPAPSARVRMRGSERSGYGSPTPGKLGFLCVLLQGSTAHFCSGKELVTKFGQKSPSGFPLRSAPPGSAPPAPRRNPGRTRASERTEDSDTALGLPTPGAPIPSGLRLLPHQGSNKSFWPRGSKKQLQFSRGVCRRGVFSPLSSNCGEGLSGFITPPADALGISAPNDAPVVIDVLGNWGDGSRG